VIVYPREWRKELRYFSSFGSLLWLCLCLLFTLLLSVGTIFALIEYAVRPISMDNVTARFHIPTRHQDWNEIIYEITPTMKHFTLLFSRLNKAFNCCKMIGLHTRWWNDDLALSGDFIPFHRVGNNIRGVSLWWNYCLLSPLRFIQKIQFS